jgi:anti-sigma factor RsiW
VTCQELVELVSDYLEGALPADERARVEAHLEICPGCRAYLELLRATVGELGRLEAGDLPPALQDDLLRAFRDWRSRES